MIIMPHLPSAVLFGLWEAKLGTYEMGIFLLVSPRGLAIIDMVSSIDGILIMLVYLFGPSNQSLFQLCDGQPDSKQSHLLRH